MNSTTKFDMKQFEDRFEIDDTRDGFGSFVLTSVGCMNRMKDESLFRELELDTRVDTFGRGAEADERMIMNHLATLKRCGLQPSPGQSIENFIIKNMDTISRYNYEHIL